MYASISSQISVSLAGVLPPSRWVSWYRACLAADRRRRLRSLSNLGEEHWATATFIAGCNAASPRASRGGQPVVLGLPTLFMSIWLGCCQVSAANIAANITRDLLDSLVSHFVTCSFLLSVSGQTVQFARSPSKQFIRALPDDEFLSFPGGMSRKAVAGVCDAFGTDRGQLVSQFWGIIATLAGYKRHNARQSTRSLVRR